MNTLHLMVGLPRSGKSTKARELGYPIVEPDAIREVLHGTPYRRNVEALVWAHVHIMIQSLFQAGHTDVILDACNHTEAARSEFQSPDWQVQYHIVNTHHSICRERAVATNQEYLLPVIERMGRDYEPIGGKIDG